jgi:ABC-type transporter Mla maintaining outer membrane lipid asymmetry ATPase subunit MlaF
VLAATFLQVGSRNRLDIYADGWVYSKQALARAVYARRDLVILDDVLSGLDTTTENHVFHSLLGPEGLFRTLQATVILVSSSSMSFPASLSHHQVL